MKTDGSSWQQKSFLSDNHYWFIHCFYNEWLSQKQSTVAVEVSPLKAKPQQALSQQKKKQEMTDGLFLNFSGVRFITLNPDYCLFLCTDICPRQKLLKYWTNRIILSPIAWDKISYSFSVSMEIYWNCYYAKQLCTLWSCIISKVQIDITVTFRNEYLLLF